ncbi:hypothetical protein JYT32_00585 [Dehalococcoides mccartyi]|nr:hypothetical protein [Dehalococcoides mccartyi]
MDERRIILKFEGPTVDEDGVSFDELLGVFRHLQTAVRRMAEYRYLKSNSPTSMKEIFRSAGTLKLKAIKEGSLVAEARLHHPERVVDIGPDALEDVINGIEDQTADLPPVVMRELSAIATSLRRGTETLTITGGRKNRSVQITGKSVFFVPKKPEPEIATEQVTGRLLEIDWSKRTAELHSVSGVIPLSFDSGLDDLMYEFARKPVQIIGKAVRTQKGNITRLTVDSIMDGSDDSSFWNPDPLRDISDQEVAPFHTGSGVKLSTETDADDFLAAIFS